MNPIPQIPDNAPFSAEQRLWLNGFLAGLFSNTTGVSAAAPAGALTTNKKPLVVLYGSQTGTAEALARRTAKTAEAKGYAPQLVSMERHATVDLAKAEHLLVITSTYGDGEPPDTAQDFWAWLSSETAPQMEQTQFSVLALGDTNYPQFCEFGRKCDARFAALGAHRFHPRVDCDADYEAAAANWMEGVFAALGSLSAKVAASAPNHHATFTPVPSTMHSAGAVAGKQSWSRTTPFAARLAANRVLTRAGSEKEVRHLEIALAGSGITYDVGDALGVMPANCPELVGDLLAALGCDGEEAVDTDSGEMPLRLALTQHFDITKPSTDLLQAAAARGAGFAPLLDPTRRDDLKAWLWGREVIDVIAGLAKPFAATEFAGLLKRLQPRLYSIASSLKTHPDEVHLTLGVVRHTSHGRARKGVCSTFLADRCAPETTVPVWVQPAHGFKLPTDLSRDIIMVGPGTGIAPFRAFLEERQITGATGRNWLFFGDQRREFDYLYQDTLEGWRSDGHLARLDLAFSRDQAEKIYVQHRMMAAAAELWAWLEGGAHFYVCGDASRMAKDVDAALHQIVETAGGLSPEAARDYVSKLKAEKRYQRDVY
jgi:sulfite reductase (NADPH) flavoprotein alpha-component